jgi:Tfp pilus assembly protein PilZ
MVQDGTQREAKSVQVTFPSGKEVLDAYWGLLANGGLMLPSTDELHEGDSIALTVELESQRKRFTFHGRVVRRPPTDTFRDMAYIAFLPGEPHDLLLSAAWAEQDHTAARRSRRHPCDLEARYAPLGARADGSTRLMARILNLSEFGALVRAPVLFSIGTPLSIELDGVHLGATVAWRLEPPGRLMGVTVEAVEGHARDKLSQLLRTVSGQFVAVAHP